MQGEALPISIGTVSLLQTDARRNQLHVSNQLDSSGSEVGSEGWGEIMIEVDSKLGFDSVGPINILLT